MPSSLVSRITPPLRHAWGFLKPWVVRLVPWLLVLLPAYALNRLIYEHKVNIPFLDDWMFMQMDAKAAQGSLTLKDFFIVQMEHRMAFVRSVIMLFHQLMPGNHTGQMWLTWTLLLGTAVNVFLLLRRSTGAKFTFFWPIMALACVCIFTPVQYQIVLWAMMFQVASPAFFLSLTMVALLSPRPLWLRFITGVVCAVCATLSFATGILVWLLPVPLMLLPEVIRNARSRWIYLGLWLVAFTVTMGLYFHELKNETDPQFSYKQGNEETLHRDFKSFISQPDKSVSFVFRLLGCHLARGTSFSVMDASLIIGGLSFLLWAGAGLYWWKRFAEVKLRWQLLIWLMFGGYSVGAATLIALGRIWATRNGENAISARYVIHAVPLTVSLCVLVWLIARDVRRRHPRWRKLTTQALAGFAFTLLILQTISWAHGSRMMAVWSSSRLRGAANAMFYKTIYQTEGEIAANRKLARIADDLGLLKPPMLTNARLDNFKMVRKLLSVNTAHLSALTIESEDGMPYGIARGYASLPARERVADAVIFTYRDRSDKHWEIFHVAQVAGLPLYLLETLSRDMQFIHLPGDNLAQEGTSGFQARFDLRQLPAGTWDVMAWTLDFRTQSVYPMSGYFSVDCEKARVKKLGIDPKAVHLDKFLKAGQSKTGEQ